MSDNTLSQAVPQPTMHRTNRTHPMLIIAGCAVAVFCVAALGMISGVIPTAYSQNSTSKASAQPCPTCGTVESVRRVTAQGQANGTGAVIGGVVGGVLGNQVGKGRGKDVATVWPDTNWRNLPSPSRTSTLRFAWRTAQYAPSAAMLILAS
jgi:hypothetical protein